jgi:hypothetical protein
MSWEYPQRLSQKEESRAPGADVLFVVDPASARNLDERNVIQVLKGSTQQCQRSLRTVESKPIVATQVGGEDKGSCSMSKAITIDPINEQWLSWVAH